MYDRTILLILNLACNDEVLCRKPINSLLLIEIRKLVRSIVILALTSLASRDSLFQAVGNRRKKPKTILELKSKNEKV